MSFLFPIPDPPAPSFSDEWTKLCGATRVSPHFVLQVSARTLLQSDNLLVPLPPCCLNFFGRHYASGMGSRRPPIFPNVSIPLLTFFSYRAGPLMLLPGTTSQGQILVLPASILFKFYCVLVCFVLGPMYADIRYALLVLCLIIGSAMCLGTPLIRFFPPPPPAGIRPPSRVYTFPLRLLLPGNRFPCSRNPP